MILITCDTLRADRLGVYGYPAETSPSLDAFAREGVVFDEAYSSAPMTVPALSSMMSGLLPDEIDVGRGNDALIAPQVTTLAEILSQAGFSTGGVVSNWVLRRPPDKGGSVGISQGFEHYDDRMTERELNRDFYDRRGPATTAAAIEWLEGRKKAQNDRLFLWVHYQDPHGPYTSPPEFVRAGSAPPAEDPVLPFGTSHSGRAQLPGYQRIGNEAHASFYMDRYDGEIRFFDRAVGDLFAWLKANDMYEDSLIVFTADHGESLGEHNFWFCHGENVYRETVRVPLIVRGPRGTKFVEQISNGAVKDSSGYLRRRDLASHLDVVPSVLQALGLEAPRGRGMTLCQELPRDRLLVQAIAPMGHPHRWVGVTGVEDRMILHLPKGPRLFAYTKDPLEKQNLAESSPERIKVMMDFYSRLMDDARRSMPGGATHRRLTEKEIQNMQKLGYTAGEADEEHEDMPKPEADE